MFHTPRFWTTKNFISLLLWPLSLLYLCAFYSKKKFTKTRQVSKPVICIGNLIAGGSGKTPTAIAIGKILHEIGINFAYLSRGYGGSKLETTLITKHDNAGDVGDEPLLLAEIAPTFIAKNRFDGAKKISTMKEFDAILLDDGLQNNSLKYDFNILVIDGKIGFGNGFAIPAGPMRERLGSGLSKIDLVVVIGEVKESLVRILQHKIPSEKIVRAKIFAKNITDFSTKKFIAFCGLAYPQKFFSLLTESGIEAVKNRSFVDHHHYTNQELENLLAEAKLVDVDLITTKKDWVRLDEKFRQKIFYLDVELEFEDVDLVKRKLINAFAGMTKRNILPRST